MLVIARGTASATIGIIGVTDPVPTFVGEGPPTIVGKGGKTVGADEVGLRVLVGGADQLRPLGFMSIPEAGKIECVQL